MKPAAVVLTVLAVCVLLSTFVSAEDRRSRRLSELEYAELDRIETKAALQEVEVFNTSIEMASQFHELVVDEEAAAVAAVLSVRDQTESPRQTAEFLEDVLKDVRMPAVRRAVHLQLANVYGELEQPKKSFEHLRELITAEAQQ